MIIRYYASILLTKYIDQTFEFYLKKNVEKYCEWQVKKDEIYVNEYFENCK